MITADFLELLRCPQTLQPLALAELELLARVNARTAGEPRGNADGILDAALVRSDRTVLYPVRNGIPVLLVESAISVEP